MCNLFNVCRSAYYRWRGKPLLSTKEKEDNELTAKITMIFMEHQCRYDTRRIMHVLRKMGYTISRRRVGRLMRTRGLYCKTRRKFKHTTDSNGGSKSEIEYTLFQPSGHDFSRCFIV